MSRDQLFANAAVPIGRIMGFARPSVDFLVCLAHMLLTQKQKGAKTKLATTFLLVVVTAVRRFY